MTTSPDPGWTPLPLSPDSRVVYVDPSGSDSLSGFSPATAVRTLPVAAGLLRDKSGDQLHLKAGTAFAGSIYAGWSGRSATDPIVIGRHGDGPRPIIDSGLASGFLRQGSGARSNIAVTGIDFRAGLGCEEAGFSWLGPGANVLIEDCAFTGYAANVSVQADAGGRVSNLRIRRNQILDAMALTTHGGQGIFLNGVDGFLIEENVLDRNAANAPSMYGHNIYITAFNPEQGDYGCTGGIVRGNISTRPASHGIQLRPGGFCTGNLFVRCPIAALIGNDHYPVTGYFAVNVAQQATDINAANPRGWGVETKAGSIAVMDNVFSKKLSREPAGAMILGAGGMQMRNIVCGWPGSPDTPGVFVDPERCVELYMASLGLPATFEAFISRCRANRRGAYDARFSAAAVNQFVRAGFAGAGSGA